MNKTCRTLLENNDELISHVLFGNSTHGRASVDRPTKTCIDELYADTGFSQEDSSTVKNDRYGIERESRNSVLSAQLYAVADDDDK